MNPANQFHIADYSVFAITILISMAIGFYFAVTGGKQRTTSEYFLGNRRMASLPVAASLLVSFQSSVTMLGTPAEAYVYGVQYIIAGVGHFISDIMSLIVFVPLLHPLKLTSVFEYLELRHESHAVRVLGTVLSLFDHSTYLGIVLFGPAIALEAVTGFSHWISIVSIAAASVIYTSVGGFKAVIWTDVFQFIVMFSGFFAVIIKATIKIGGVARTWEIANKDGRLNFFDFNVDPTVRQTFWSLCIGSFFGGFGLIFTQTAFQRISSTPTVSAAKTVFLWAAPAFFLSLILALTEGIIAYSYYHVLGCDPLASKQIRDPNQLIPLLVFNIFQGLHGLPGLFMASVFSASLSSLSSGFCAMSAQFWTDLVQPHVKPMPDVQATIISKLSVVVFGVLSAGFAMLIGTIGGTLLQITVSLNAAFGGPMIGLFMFSAVCPWGNSKGGFWGTILSAILIFVISFGQMSTKGAVTAARLSPGPMDQCLNVGTTNWTENLNSTLQSTVLCMQCTTEKMTTEVSNHMLHEPTGFQRLYMVSFHWFSAIATLSVIVFGSLISFCTGYKKPGEVDKKYIISFYDSFFPFMPECILKPLRCGYKYNNRNTQEEERSDELTEMI